MAPAQQMQMRLTGVPTVPKQQSSSNPTWAHNEVTDTLASTLLILQPL